MILGKTFLETGMDRSVPYLEVILEKTDTSVYPKYELPAGFSFSQYKPGFDKQWATLNYDITHTESLEEAETIFREEFMKDFESLKQKMVFAVDENNNLAGVGAIWDGNDFGEIHQRLHWIAVAAQYQNRGIAKAVISKALDIYNNLGYNGYIYLTSQTWSYKALNIYMKFGFKPYMGEKPVNWDEDWRPVEAWNIINEKLDEYRNKKS